MKRYAADFETTTIIPARVWAWGVACTDTPEQVQTGETIDSFIEWCKGAKNPVVYFHNEKFDGSFILYYLLTNGYEWKHEKGECTGNDFTTIIDNFGKFYAIEIYWSRKGHKVHKCTIYDSFKIIPMSVEKAAKDFGLKIEKLEIDYTAHDEPGKPVTEKEWEYLHNDVSIMAQVLHFMFENEMTKITIGACALSDYKKFIGQRMFDCLFPKIPFELDSQMRPAYKGGWCYANPEHAGQDVGKGMVFDVNSLYPSQMASRPLPWGVPWEYSGQYEHDEKFPLYIQKLRCAFELKPGFLPTIQLKHNGLFQPTEYLKDSGGEIVDLCLCSCDLELFLRHYDVYFLEYLGGWKFRARSDMFTAWVNKWAQKKIESDRNGNKAMRQLCKLMMNNLYGKFSTNPIRRSKKPLYSKNLDCVCYQPIKTKCKDKAGKLQRDENGEPLETDYEIVDSVYLPVGAFITAWARYTTISAAQKIHGDSLRQLGYSRFCYSDTDSIHILGTELPDIDIDAYRLGAWKHESSFTRARFVQAKRYIEDENGELKVTCAGMPAACHKYVTWDNFHIGASYPGKLIPKTVPGGTILVETKFTMK